MHRDAGLITDRRQQLELGFAELPRHHAVDVEHAEDLVGGAQRRAHHRANPLLHDALAADVALVHQRIVGERRDALVEHVVDHGARQRHRAGRLAVLGAHRHQVDLGGVLVTHQDRGAIAAGYFEDRRHDRIEQRFDAGRARQDLRHLVKRRQVLLRGLEQVRLVLALVDLRQKLELVRIDGALHQRVAARLDDAERGGDVVAARGPGRVDIDQLEDGRADPQLVSFGERDGGDALVVDERTVGRLEVGDRAAVFAAP